MEQCIQLAQGGQNNTDTVHTCGYSLSRGDRIILSDPDEHITHNRQGWTDEYFCSQGVMYKKNFEK